MAYRATTQRLCAYGISLASLNQQLRAFSARTQPAQSINVLIVRGRSNGLLPPTKEFPLPGQVTSQLCYDQQHTNTEPLQPSVDLVKTVNVDELLPHAPNGDVMPARRCASIEDVCNSGNLEMTVVECPRLLHEHVVRMFVDRPTSVDNKQPTVTVLNLTQKSVSDMSVWTPAMERERDQLTMVFIESATSICAALRELGYWADFIDPASGRPYLGKFTNHTLFETDEYYNLLGYQIEDLGCCKVTKHMLWGTHAFIGTIFTNAPTNAEAINQIRNMLNETNTNTRGNVNIEDGEKPKLM